jgi:hypothetical protein
MKLKNKKELNEFILNSEKYVGLLIKELNVTGISGDYETIKHKIDDIQDFYSKRYMDYPDEMQIQLRLAFWAFFGKILTEKVGGEWHIASKTDYAEGTPQLVDYGRNGKRWRVALSVDSWLNTLLKGKLTKSLNDKLISIEKDFS